MVNKTTVNNNKKKLEIVNKKKPEAPKKKPEAPKKKLEENTDDNGALDEKGNPFPIKNPEGGDPICPGGYKIDYQFDIFDPINPLFRCIPSLKEDGDGGLANKMLSMANDPSSGVEDVMTGNFSIGGKRKHLKKIKTRRIRRNGRRRSHRRKS